jgi:hypothetical protein
MHKCTVLMLVTCLVASCLIVHAVTPVSAQAGFKLFVPQFSVQFVDRSYDIPPSTTTTVLSKVVF